MNSKRIRQWIVAGMTALCLLSVFTGCKGSGGASEERAQNVGAESQEEKKEKADSQGGTKEEIPGETKEDAAPGSKASGETGSSGSETESKEVPLLPNATGWAVQKYKDPYLSYEIPESWGKNDDQSSDEMLFAFFQSKDPRTDYPSNVNVQITQLDTGNNPMSIDYGSAEIQEEFHQFLISDMGLPAEAAEGKFSVARTGNGVYVYSLGFERKAMDNTMVHQTIYLPMDMQHSIVIWATDFREGAKVSADEAAMHICETLEIVK